MLCVSVYVCGCGWVWEYIPGGPCAFVLSTSPLTASCSARGWVLVFDVRLHTLRSQMASFLSMVKSHSVNTSLLILGVHSKVCLSGGQTLRADDTHFALKMALLPPKPSNFFSGTSPPCGGHPAALLRGSQGHDFGPSSHRGTLPPTHFGRPLSFEAFTT